MAADPHAEELVQRCLAGDPIAWEEFVRMFASLLRHRLGAVASKQGFSLSSADLDDILSKVWEDLLSDRMRLFRAYEPGTRIDRWLLTIAVHRMLSSVRERGKAEMSVDPDRLPSLAQDVSPDLPERPLAQEETEEHLQAAVRRLPPRELFAVRVFYWFGWSHQRIARVLGIPLNHVGPLLGNARKRLQALLRRSKDFPIILL